MRISKEIISITTGPRQANFELIRILAMFLVLVYHADFWTIGRPTYNEISSDTFPTLTRIFIEALSVVCVNVFVMISGWFKIKASWKGFFNFIFQCLFFSILLYVIAVISGHTSISFKGLMECLYVTPLNWFVKAYLALYIISPVLNAFIDNVSELKFKYSLISLFLFEFIFGITGAAGFIESGLSCYSFICLYLLSSYIRIYICPRYSRNNILKWSGVIGLLSVCCNVLIYIVATKKVILYSLVTYIGPLVILQTVSLILLTYSVRLKPSKLITFFAESSFAVYLVHTNSNYRSDFKSVILELYNQNSGMPVIVYIFLFLVLIFIVSVIIDKIRLIIWKDIYKLFFKNI